MLDWNGKAIKVAQSKGGVKAVAHPLDNLISKDISPWPPAEIVQKLYKSRQQDSFSDEQQKICTDGLGYYCDLQSLNSEDAVTWSVFGTVARSRPDQREAWVAHFLRLLGLPAEISSISADICLWRRIPHPESRVLGGPEIDFTIITENAIILGEAKWKSGVGRNQGLGKDKNQIELRGMFLDGIGKKLFPQPTYRVVVGVGLADNSFESTIPAGVMFKSATWKDVCNISSHPLFGEIKRYYEWKVANSATNNMTTR